MICGQHNVKDREFDQNLRYLPDYRSKEASGTRGNMKTVSCTPLLLENVFFNNLTTLFEFHTLLVNVLLP